MSVGIATMGYFNPKGCSTVDPGGIGGIGGEGGGGGYYEDLKRKPVILIRNVDTGRSKPTIEITEVEIL